MDLHPYDIVRHKATRHDKIMPHGIYVRLKPCHVAPNLGYEKPHGTHVMPCHVASK